MHKPYASVIVKLMQSHALYDNDHTYWQLLESHEAAIRSYFETIGIELDFKRREGYARLVQKEFSEDDESRPLKLIRRVSLTYEQSLLCVLLREWLEEHEVSTHQASTRLYVTQEQVRDRIEMFFKHQTNRKALHGKLDDLVEKLAGYGLLKLTRRDEVNPANNQYEVKPLLKAKLSNEKLEEFRNKLQNDEQSKSI